MIRNTGLIPMLFQLSETSNPLSFNFPFFIKEQYTKFFHSLKLVNPIFKLEVQIVMILSSRGT